MEAGSPHVILFPLPMLGHVSPMLKLAKVLSLRGLLVTFLTTEHVHRRLSAHDGVNSRPGFFIRSIPDGLPADHPRSAGRFMEVIVSLAAQPQETYRDLLVFLRHPWPVTYAIVDVFLPFVAEVGEKLGIPVTTFSTGGPCGFWADFCIPKLIEAGEIPFPGPYLHDVARRPVPKSVVYVSFGSLTVLSRPQLLEFWHGLANSGHRFLWVIRPDMLKEADGPGCVVEWVNQREVLAHPAVGAFLTHSGWNSTLEAISAGVPMICWPFFFDQMVNSRFVSEVWRIGLDMKDTCDRGTVGMTVKAVMEGERADDMRRNVAGLSEMVRECVDEGGSSRIHLDQLIEDIRAVSLETSAGMLIGSHCG
ncbi:unnamed protein product [Spirodela intermedia]|uniref:Uncharacterized protein n=1 Tax=Spirodela intermedia TaxID=51605 RepID=A0A7I8JDA2_SPIIN|nr:unnamed protein product [Spirodela intermedia]CAA6667981.1 unnamed protein product [Spirodela intermedia]